MTSEERPPVPKKLRKRKEMIHDQPKSRLKSLSFSAEGHWKVDKEIITISDDRRAPDDVLKTTVREYFLLAHSFFGESQKLCYFWELSGASRFRITCVFETISREIFLRTCVMMWSRVTFAKNRGSHDLLHLWIPTHDIYSGSGRSISKE